MTKIELDLPRAIRVNDYHEFYTMQDYLQTLNTKIKVVEIGYAGYDYIGIIYYNKQDASFKELKELVRQQIKAAASERAYENGRPKTWKGTGISRK